MTTVPKPAFVYKISDEPLPSPVPDELPLSALDAQDGFIHLSVAELIPTTVKLFFGDHKTIYVYKVDVAAIEQNGGRLEWLSGELDGCVHCHGGLRLGRALIIGQQRFSREAQEQWGDVAVE